MPGSFDPGTLFYRTGPQIDLTSPNMLSDDVFTYLSRVFLREHRRLREDYVLQIISETPINEDKVKNTILNEVRQQQDDIRFALRRLMLKMIVPGVLGAAILALWLYLSATTETVGVEILSIMGLVCVWEATSIAVLQRPELRRVWLNLERLNRADIAFKMEDEQKN